jgi:hypothetical protein
MDYLIVVQDVFSDNSDEDEDFLPLHKLLLSSSHKKILVDTKPGLDNTIKINS